MVKIDHISRLIFHSFQNIAVIFRPNKWKRLLSSKRKCPEFRHAQNGYSFVQNFKNMLTQRQPKSWCVKWRYGVLAVACKLINSCQGSQLRAPYSPPNSMLKVFIFSFNIHIKCTIQYNIKIIYIHYIYLYKYKQGVPKKVNDSK